MESNELGRELREVPDPKIRDSGKEPNGLWIENYEIPVEVFIYKNVDTEEIFSISETRMTEESRVGMDCVEISVVGTFSVPDRKHWAAYRNACQVWVEDGGVYLNHIRLGRILLTHHLSSLSVAGKLLPLSVEKLGSRLKLTLESEGLLDKLHPTVLEKLVLKYRVVANLSN